MMANVAIPIAGFKDVYDVPAVEKALHELPASANEALRSRAEALRPHFSLGPVFFLSAIRRSRSSDLARR